MKPIQYVSLAITIVCLSIAGISGFTTLIPPTAIQVLGLVAGTLGVLVPLVVPSWLPAWLPPKAAMVTSIVFAVATGILGIFGAAPIVPALTRQWCVAVAFMLKGIGTGILPHVDSKTV